MVSLKAYSSRLTTNQRTKNPKGGDLHVVISIINDMGRLFNVFFFNYFLIIYDWA
jgi:hypothetical protein